MLKNTLKGVLALAAIGCLAAPATQASAQMPFGTPVYSTRLGGSLVAGMNVGYYNNGIGMMSSPVLTNGVFANSGGFIVRPFPQLPLASSGRMIALSTGTNLNGSAVLTNGGLTVRPFPQLPLASSGRMIALSQSGSLGGTAGSNIGAIMVFPFPPLPSPSSGRMIPLAAPRR